VLENLTTLTGKYGEEGDQLLFKVLNSGDFLKDTNPETLQNKDSKKLIPQIADRGLRYDLTVPLARYVVQHQGDLVFPFKRYHIAPVWRADRPQKGRYREFYQCDADVIGSNSLLNEVELLKIFIEVFKSLNISVEVHINHRLILEGIAEVCGAKDRASDLINLFDKLDKIGSFSVLSELANKGFDVERISSLMVDFNSLNERAIVKSENLVDEFNRMRTFFSESVNAIKGLDDLKRIFDLCCDSDKKSIVLNKFLARGLNYYTGIIWEVVLDKNVEANKNISIGSLGGGGRYGNLTEMFGGINMSGVGISFGIERIYDVMEELNLFPTTITQGVKVLLVPREESLEDFTFSQVQKLREQGISAEIFLGNVKKQKQFTYAEQKHIAYLIEVGENEQQSGLFRLRNAVTREMENDLSIEKIIEKLK
jgi:histidyl-tRNA synthetase